MSPLRVIKENAGLVLLFSVLTGSLSLNVYLGRELKALTPVRLPSAGIHKDAVLPQIQAVDVDGHKTVIDFNGPRSSVVYILSPTCSWCKRNKANIVALASQKGREMRFVGLSITSEKLKDYVTTNSLPFPVYAIVSPQAVQKLGVLDMTPQTVLVRAGGIVEKVWTGAFDAAKQKEIEQYFHAKLPGLQEPIQGPLDAALATGK
jgi:hypothetical protein